MNENWNYLYFQVAPASHINSCVPVILTPTVNCPSQATEETSTLKKPAENVVRTTKGLQERTQLFEWDDDA